MSKLSTLVDDFSGGALDPSRWVLEQGTIAVGSGRLALECLSGYTVVGSALTYDMVGSQFSARVTPPPLSTTREFAVKLMVPAATETNSLATIISGEGQTALLMRRMRNGVSFDTSMPYNPVAHAFWRIREQGGFAFWEFSPDGSVWTVARTEAHALNLGIVEVEISCGFYGTDVTPDPGAAGTYGSGNYGDGTYPAGGTGSVVAPAVSTGPGYGLGLYGDGVYGTGEAVPGPDPQPETPSTGYITSINTGTTPVPPPPGPDPASGYGAGLYGDGLYGGSVVVPPDPDPTPDPPPPVDPPPVTPPGPPYDDGGYSDGGYGGAGNEPVDPGGQPQFSTKPTVAQMAGRNWIRY